MIRKTTQNVNLNSSGEQDVTSSPDSSFERTRNTHLLNSIMADNSEDDSENGDEDIANKIRKLEREKAKLEKQSLRQKYKDLKETVGSLKSASVSSSGICSGPGTSSSSSLHSSGSEKKRSRGSDTNMVNSSLSSVLNENRARLENLQKHGGRRSKGEYSDESDGSDVDHEMVVCGVILTPKINTVPAQGTIVNSDKRNLI
ncbi:hypothetical protein KUTeg_011457 [Tegillarca granosa]|uniref:Uncharacterized protein n=1 Tax=Tegillarca granosa TaxID=220873 RepID=A0ABQ9F426_TEGGR|nr:hypothetical protein KUTeg_011457 [Tegillarca granosa]